MVTSFYATNTAIATPANQSRHAPKDSLPQHYVSQHVARKPDARPEPRGSPRRLHAVVGLGIALRAWAALPHAHAAGFRQVEALTPPDFSQIAPAPNTSHAQLQPPVFPPSHRSSLHFRGSTPPSALASPVQNPHCRRFQPGLRARNG